LFRLTVQCHRWIVAIEALVDMDPVSSYIMLPAELHLQAGGSILIYQRQLEGETAPLLKLGLHFDASPKSFQDLLNQR
jgi:hypothetical protein